MPRQTLPLVAFTAVAGFLLGLVAAGTRSGAASAVRTPAAPLVLTAAEAPASPDAPAPTGLIDFASVAARLNAAVVNVENVSRETDPPPFRRLPSDDPNPPREVSGSGFVIDASGFILTNQHVVAGADRVTVTLADGRSVRADVIGVDPAIDVALLQVHVADQLPAAPLGDSDALRVGEWVCAIGNPLGIYVHSVTVGVVSFLGRKIFDEGLDAFIQTDAAISLGNSGGPLINARGEVVGITTAMSVQATGIGFAVPISQVLAVLPQLRERGTVARGFIGASLGDVTPDIRRALHVEPAQGALVEDVVSDTPAERAGLRLYDVIVGADGAPVVSGAALIRHISARQPGTVSTLDVWRDGVTRTLQVKLADRPLADEIRRRTPLNADARPVGQVQAPLGITVRDLDAADYRRLPDTAQGVFVVDVDPAGPARVAAVRPAQIILEINRRRVASSADYRAVAGALAPGDVAALLIFDRLSGKKFIASLTVESGS